MWSILSQIIQIDINLINPYHDQSQKLKLNCFFRIMISKFEEINISLIQIFLILQMGTILENMIQKIHQLQQHFRIESNNIFQVNENYPFTKDQIMKSLRFAVSSNATDYRLFRDVQPHLRGVMFYLMGSEGYEPAEQLLAMEEEALWMTPKYVLFMYQSYLQKVVPTNITFYHFMRQKEFYTHFVALKYVMVVGLAQISQHIFLKLKHHRRVELFKLLLEWLLTLIHYRCSALYIKSNCVDPLIKQTHLLLSALIGFDSSSILTTLIASEIQDVFNKLLYMNAFLLSIAVSTNDHLSMSIVIAVVRKLLTSISRQKITTYLPSYLYASLIGFIPTPYTHKIVLCLLVYFLTLKYQHNQNMGSADNFVNENYSSIESLVVDCWSILSLITQQYEFDEQIQIVTRDLIRHSIPKLQSKSMIRGFVTRIIHNLHLDGQDEYLKKYVTNGRKPYLVGDKVLKIEVFCKNYLIAKESWYLQILREGAKDRWFHIEETAFWKTLTMFNKFEIQSKAEYLKNHALDGVEAT